MDNIALAITAIITTLLFIVLAGQLAVLRVQREMDGKINGTLTLTLLGLIPLVAHKISNLTGAKVVFDPNNEKACDVELLTADKSCRMQNVYFGKRVHHEKIVERITGYINHPNGVLSVINPPLAQFILRISIPVIMFIASITWLIVLIIR